MVCTVQSWFASNLQNKLFYSWLEPRSWEGWTRKFFVFDLFLSLKKVLFLRSDLINSLVVNLTAFILDLMELFSVKWFDTKVSAKYEWKRGFRVMVTLFSRKYFFSREKDLTVVAFTAFLLSRPRLSFKNIIINISKFVSINNVFPKEKKHCFAGDKINLKVLALYLWNKL